MAIFFTSDTHFGHARIIDLVPRPFKDVAEMNEILVKNWNETVSPEDTVFHLGDVALGPIRDSLEHIRRLNGRKILVIGNHDRNFRLGKRSGGLEPEEWDEEYVKYGFQMVVGAYASTLGPDMRNIFLSHFPYDGDSHGEDRHAAARLFDGGVALIHGHTHSTGDALSFSAKGTPQIHVGVDAWDYRPVSEAEVMAVLSRAV